MKNYKFASSFTLKIFAFVCMAIDHLAVILDVFYSLNKTTNALFPLYMTMRAIGRLALPLFCFMIAEGMMHTKSYKKYALKLGIMAVLISTTLCVCQYVKGLDAAALADEGNIFIDLLLGSLAIFFLQKDKPAIKLLAIIPIGISVASYVAKGMEMALFGEQYWYPKFLRMQYDWLSVGMIVLFYLAKPITKWFFEAQEEKTGISAKLMENTPQERTAQNLFSLLLLVVITLSYYLGKYFAPNWQFYDVDLQLIMMVSGLLIICYNGNRGYNAKWFKYGSYLFYPLHIAVIYGIVYLISLI